MQFDKGPHGSGLHLQTDSGCGMKLREPERERREICLEWEWGGGGWWRERAGKGRHKENLAAEKERFLLGEKWEKKRDFCWENRSGFSLGSANGKFPHFGSTEPNPSVQHSRFNSLKKKRINYTKFITLK